MTRHPQRQVRRRDAKDAATEPPVPRGVGDLLYVLGTSVVGFTAGIVLPALMFEFASSIVAWSGLAAVLFCVGLVAGPYAVLESLEPRWRSAPGS